MSPKETAYIVERLAVRFMSMVADCERKMVEHRDAFGVRTSADAKIIDGMRAEVEDLRNRLNSLGIQAAKRAGEALSMVEGEGLLGAALRVVKERDALRAEVADLRGNLDMVHVQLGIFRGDDIWTAIEALKTQSVMTPKRSHPVEVGQWVRRTYSNAGHQPLKGFEAGLVVKVVKVRDDIQDYVLDGEPVRVWDWKNCEPCDPPEASHDTPAGKEAAASVIRNSQMTEIKVGDVVEVVSASGGQTWMADVGSTGKVRRFELIDSIECVRLQNLPGKRNALGGYVSLCDVRKVTT